MKQKAKQSVAPPEVTSDDAVRTPPAPQIAALRRAASDYVTRAIGHPLAIDDDSEESLAFADHYLRQVRNGEPLRTEIRALVAAALGVYLGQVLIARFGGRWVAPPGAAESADPIDWRVELESAPLICDPIGMADAALQPRTGLPAAETAETDASETDEPASARDEAGFTTRPELDQALRAALTRLPPVSEEYFYSLTGRFETISYAVELLAELLQLQLAAKPLAHA